VPALTTLASDPGGMNEVTYWPTCSLKNGEEGKEKRKSTLYPIGRHPTNKKYRKVALDRSK